MATRSPKRKLWLLGMALVIAGAAAPPSSVAVERGMAAAQFCEPDECTYGSQCGEWCTACRGNVGICGPS